MANRIDVRLKALKDEGRPALAPFITVGFPDVATSEALAEVTASAGGDILELGIPFSDPLAEGLTIQKTSFRALQQGVNVSLALDVLRRLRAKNPEVPLIFMGYINPFLRHGFDRFVREAGDAGLDGLIVPDLPTEEAEPFKKIVQSESIYLIPLLAPTSTDERIARACKGAKGFIYCVSLTGVTGAREELASGLRDLVGRIRRHTELPVLVGFGVSRREHLDAISRFAEGALIGSAFLDAIDRAPRERVLETAREFLAGLVVPGGMTKA